MKAGKYLLLLLIVAITSCKKPYDPPAISTPSGYLVVEGVINSGADSTFIKLSRTVNIANKVSAHPELNATLSVQGDQNVSYPLQETGNGNYACAGLNLDNTHKYRLSIKTANNEQFLSDYQAVLNSPPIDSVSFDTKGTVSTAGLNIYVNTHDQNNKILYYRWEYQETWIFHSAFFSGFKSNGDTVLARDIINDNINQCWLSDTSSSIILGSSAKLSKDVIASNLITTVPSTSEKVGFEYSIIVKQYALTAEAYTFYTNIKKNTEQLGSIFDAEPSEISGNIHSVTYPSEPVIGYINVGNSSSQRIFIPNRLLPAWTFVPYYSNSACQLVADPSDPLGRAPCCNYKAISPATGLPVNQVNEYINYDIGNYAYPFIPIGSIGFPGGPPIGYTAATPECADCTLRGTNKKPAFWQ